MNNYEKLIQRISKSSGLLSEEIERKVEAKKAKLSGLISKEGAAQIVAAELGINFDQEKMKISELVEGMKKVNVIGKIVQVNPIREFNKNGRQGKVASFLLADETSNVRTVLWDTHHISLLEKSEIKIGSNVEISNAAMRKNELHLSSFSDLKLSNEKIDNVIVQQSFQKKKFSQTKPGEYINNNSVIVQIFEPRYFEVCPECGKKVIDNECKNHGTIIPIKKALLNIILDDGSETMRTVIVGEQIKNLGFGEEIFSIESFNETKNKIIGEEKLFKGQIRSNNLYNTIEFSIQEVSDINPEELIKELELL